MICKTCGEIISDRAVVCPKCGTRNPDMYANQPPSAPVSRPAAPIMRDFPSSMPNYNGYAPLPYANPQSAHMPLYPTKKSGSAAVAVIAVIVFAVMCVIVSIFAFTQKSNVQENFTSLITQWNKGSVDNPFLPGESTTITCGSYDTSLQACNTQIGLSLVKLVSGEEANMLAEQFGGDPSRLEDHSEYVMAKFQVTLNRSDSDLPVIISAFDNFMFDDGDPDTYKWLEEEDAMNLPSLRLDVGETGEITTFAVVDKKAEYLQAVFLSYVDDSKELYCFSAS
jgi:hypothetical protein